MKKFNSLYFMELRLVIFKFLILMAAMTLTYILLYFAKGLKYAEAGFNIVIRFAGFDKIAMVFGIASVALIFGMKMLTYNTARQRNKLSSVTNAQVLLAGFMESFTVMLLWYAFTVLAFFLIVALYVNRPGYLGGGANIIINMILSPFARAIIPYTNPWRFLVNFGLLAIVSLLTCIPEVMGIIKNKKDMKNEDIMLEK